MNLLGDKPDPAGFQTDVRRKAALVTADPGPSRGIGGGGGEDADLSGVTSAEYLRAAEEEVNRAVDREVETLVEGMEEIVGLAAVGGPDKTRAMQESLAISLRAETLTRAVTSLLGLTHSLKMMWILGDDAYSRRVRRSKRAEVVEEVEQLKVAVAQELRRLKGGS